MKKGELLAGESVFAALYLRGLRGADGTLYGRIDGGMNPGTRRWPKVEAALRGLGGGLEGISNRLRKVGLWEESCVLDEPGRLAAGVWAVESGRVLTVFGGAYPAGWRRRLGVFAPPALWCFGKPPRAGMEFVGAVGSRICSWETLQCALAAERVERAGASRFSFSSSSFDGGGDGQGGGWGDTGAETVEIVPYGLERHGARSHGARKREERDGHRRRGDGEEGRTWVLGVAPPEAGFTTGLAMERNALIYAFGLGTVVVRADYRRGGTWAGATDALRRRLGPIWVGRDGSRAALALEALGARGVRLSRDGATFAEGLSAAMALEESAWDVSAWGDRGGGNGQGGGGTGSLFLRERRVWGCLEREGEGGPGVSGGWWEGGFERGEGRGLLGCQWLEGGGDLSVEGIGVRGDAGRFVTGVLGGWLRMV